MGRNFSADARALVVVLVAGLALANCGGGGSDDDLGPDGGKAGIDRLPQGWTRIQPGGRTLCARGDPWEFYVRPGKVNKVVVEFEGGGVCFNDVSCLPGAHVFVDYLRIPPAMQDESLATGILDHADARNPFRDWHHVYVPYCTGDLHWGDSDHEYTLGTPYTVHHRGAVNVRAVLDWMKENVLAPEEVFSTGSSGGSYASIMWAPHLARLYPSARVTQVGDSGAGVLKSDIVPLLVATWNVAASFPDFIPGAELSEMKSIGQLYETVGTAYPEMQLAQYNTSFDWDQLRWFALMGGSKDPFAWSTEMKQNVADIAAALPGFRSYLAPGWKHSILEFPQFYTMRSGGVAFADWISSVLARNATSVECGQHCGAPQMLSGSAGWECTSGTPVTAGPIEPALELPFQFLHYDPPDFAVFPGLTIEACDWTDDVCASPLDSISSDAAGHGTVHVAAGTGGFLGYLAVKGAGVSYRLYIRPAIRNPQHEAVGDSYTWGVPDATAMDHLAKSAGVARDPSLGYVAAYMLDCNLSWRSDVLADLDGVAPTAFAGLPSWVPSQTPNSVAHWVNVAPGKHTVNLSLAGAGTNVASADIWVDAGGFTVLAGLSPAAVQP